MYRKTGLGFAFLAILVAWSLYLVSSGRIPLGLDLRGGTELTYDLDLSMSENPDQLATEVKDILQRRFNASGLKELSIAIQGTNRLVIQLPGGDQEAVDLLAQQIERAGALEFRIVADSSEHQNNLENYRAQESKYQDLRRSYYARLREWNERAKADPTYEQTHAFDKPRDPNPPEYIVRNEELRDSKTNEVTGYRPMVLMNAPGSWVDGHYLSGVGPTIDENGGPAVAFAMSGEGASLFGDLTGSNIGKRLAIVLDEVVVSAPNLKSRITTNGQITGRFTNEEVKSLITVLRGGSLPVKPQRASESTVGSVLGQAAIREGMFAVFVGLALVFAVMAGYYLVGGLIADFALILNVLFVLAFVVVFRQDLTLPGIAGVLLTIGMAVDANILIFERVREERNRGKSLLQALTLGYQRAFGVIVDSNLTTLITGIVLLNFGTGPVKGFAVTLIAGIIFSFFSSLFVTKLIVSFLVNQGWVTEFKMLQAFKTPNYPFVEKQRRFLVASVVVLGLLTTLVAVRGRENYGIDFTGGARIRMALREAIPRSEIESKIDALAAESPELFRDKSVQSIGEIQDGKASEFAILTRAGSRAGTKVANAQTAQPETPPGGVAPGTPGAAPPVAPRATTDSTTTATGDTAPTEDAAERVRDVLEVAFKDRLLPEGFPSEPTWTAVGESGDKAFGIEVNLRTLQAGVDETWIRTKLGEHLKADAKFTEIGVARVAKASTQSDAAVTRFEVELDAYAVPEIAQVGGEPVAEETAARVRSFFRSPPAFNEQGAAPFELSDPFPQVSTVGPRVASDLQGKALVALFISMLGIIFYVSLRFEFNYGIAAILALVHDVLFSIGCMALMDTISDRFLGGAIPIKLNLPELAALLTIVGYSINDTIVIFDRIRENVQANGKKRDFSFRETVNASINQTLSRTLWTTLSTLLTVIALLVFGGEAIRGFAFTFLVGLISGTYSTVFVASPILIWLQERAVQRKVEAEALTLA
jgi:SecD/SecF fusion protein